MAQSVHIFTNSELYRFLAEDIVYIEADRNYTNFYLVGGEKRMFVMQLGMVEMLLAHQLKEQAAQFVRIGRKLIINIGHLYYIHPQHQQLILKSPKGERYELSASQAALSDLKQAIEKPFSLDSMNP